MWHDGLILKLKQNGVSGSLLTFFQKHLKNRKQRVALNGSYSSYSTVESGLPQGSVLCPLLLLFYFFFMHFCPWMMTTHAESINSDLQRGLDRLILPQR